MLVAVLALLVIVGAGLVLGLATLALSSQIAAAHAEERPLAVGTLQTRLTARSRAARWRRRFFRWTYFSLAVAVGLVVLAVATAR